MPSTYTDALFCEREGRGLPFLAQVLERHAALQFELQSQDFDEGGNRL